MIPVFYRPEQACDEASSYSPSAGKPAKAVADWLSNPAIASHLAIQSFDVASAQALYAAHSKDYVDGVLSGQRVNGFGTKSPGIAASLRYTTGSMMAATVHVLTHKVAGLNVAVSPTSGFHHAGYFDGGGFCTFNGLMASAIHVHTLGLARRILIVDMDQHYGDGTDDIIEKLGIDYVDRITARKSYQTAAQVLQCAELRSVQPGQYDLVLYQAGADMHVNDPLGGLLTTEQMQQRDRAVFGSCARLGIPIVWNLAGGYQRDAEGGIEPVLALHRNTMLECIFCQSESLTCTSRSPLSHKSNAADTSEKSDSPGNQADTIEQVIEQMQFTFTLPDETDQTQTILNVTVDGEDSGYAICGELYQGHWRFWKETLLSDTAFEMLLDADDTTFPSLLEEFTSEPATIYVETLDEALKLLNPLWPKLYLFSIHPDFANDIWLRALAYWSNADFVDPNIVSWWSQYCLGNEITSIDEVEPFPWDLPAHWHNFANALRKTLAHMAQDQYLILLCKGSNRFVQFSTQHKIVRIEASSNHYLSGRDDLSEKDIQVLLQLGWKEPTGTPEQSTPERDPNGSSNFFLELPLNNNLTRLTTLAIKTLSEVMGVPHVEYLAYNAFGVSGGDVSYPELGIKREVLEPTVQMEELAGRLLGALREVSGCATLKFDADGDVDVTIEGQIYWVRLIGKSLMEHPMIRLHVPLLVEVDLDQQLLEQLNQLNLRGAPVRHVWIDNMVWGMLDIPAWPLKVQHIETSLSLFADVASRSALWLVSEIETPVSSLRH